MIVAPHAAAASDERNCHYVNSRGLLKSCDVFPKPPTSSTRRIYDHDWSSLRSGDSVYVHGSAIPAFYRDALPRIKMPIVLVSGDCDETMPIEAFPSEAAFRNFIDHPCIAHWFAQNLIVRHPKCTLLPIGLDFHTLSSGAAHRWGPISSPAEQEDVLKSVAQRAPAWKDRAPLGYGNFHFQLEAKFGDDRKSALARISQDALYLEPHMASRLASWEKQITYAFVISPHGNGLDCHRTWEALTLGCIPVLKHSPLDPLFEGLPVLLVHDWSHVTTERLKAVHANPPPTIKPEKLTLPHWIGLMRERQGACRRAAI